MPQPLTVSNIMSATYNGSDTHTWTANFKSTDGTTDFGTLTNGSSQSYSHTGASSFDKNITIVIDSGGDPMDIDAGDTITISTSVGDVDIYLPSINAADMNTYYVDSNGLLYSDENLTMPVLDTASTEESLSTGETDVPSVDSDDVLLSMYEDEWGFPDALGHDTVTVSEDTSVETVFVLLDSVVLDENVGADNVGYLVEITRINDSTFVARPIHYGDVVSTFDSVDIVHPVIAGDVVHIGDAISIPANIYQRIVEQLTIADSLNIQTLVFVLTDAVGVGEGFKNKRGTTSADDTDQYTGQEQTIIVTTPFDFGQRGYKFIDFIEVGGSTIDDVELMLAFRYKQTEDWRNTNWIRLNNEGVAFMGVAGNEFKLAVRRKKGRFVPTYVMVYWKLLDKRYVRSGYVTSQEANA